MGTESDRDWANWAHRLTSPSVTPMHPELAPGKPHEGDHDEDTDADTNREPSPVRAPETSRGTEGEAGELDGHLRGL